MSQLDEYLLHISLAAARVTGNKIPMKNMPSFAGHVDAHCNALAQ
jgi:hypothetical protein